MAKDFFDEEFDKIQQKQQEEQQQTPPPPKNDWYSYQPSSAPVATNKKSKKTLVISLTCVALVLALVLGWVLCALFGSSGSLSTNEQRKYAEKVVQKLRDSGVEISDDQLKSALDYSDELLKSGQIGQEAVLSSVLDYLHNNYYKEIPSEQWDTAVAAAGTSLMQSAGDPFCHLFTPQQYYNYKYQVSSTVVGDPNAVFGFAYAYQSGLGLYVSSVSTDSSCYGVIQAGDIILSMSEVAGKNSTHVTVDGSVVTEIYITDFTETDLRSLMTEVYSARFTLLRDGRVITTPLLTKGAMGLENPKYDFQFVEFYFDGDHTNISTENQNNATTNTFDLRGLRNLPRDTGYIRIVEFMYYTSGTQTVTAATEFQQVMMIFKQLGLKRLVLDLKGNPGGLVDAVCDIAAMLITDDYLSETEKATVTYPGDMLLITSLVPRSGGERQLVGRQSTYSQYFSLVNDGTRKIVVWTDGNSASASELLTGTLRDYNTGFQIGTTTYGKGIAQTIEELPYTGTAVSLDGHYIEEHWAVYYTFAAYYSPLGKNIHGTGYTPITGYNGIESYGDLWQATLRYWQG